MIKYHSCLWLWGRILPLELQLECMKLEASFWQYDSRFCHYYTGEILLHFRNWHLSQRLYWWNRLCFLVIEADYLLYRSFSVVALLYAENSIYVAASSWYSSLVRLDMSLTTTNSLSNKRGLLVPILLLLQDMSVHPRWLYTLTITSTSSFNWITIRTLNYQVTGVAWVLLPHGKYSETAVFKI